MNTTDTSSIDTKLSSIQSILTNFCGQPRVTELYIDDLPATILALSQWLVAYDETPHSMCFYLRSDNVGMLYTQLCINTHVRIAVEEKLNCLLRTSSVAPSSSTMVYKRDLYRAMLQEIKKMFGMNASPYFNFDENRDVPIIVVA